MDKLLLKQKDAVTVSLFLVTQSYVDKENVKEHAKQGLVPSGYVNRNGLTRITFIESPIIAEYLLYELDKESEDIVVSEDTISDEDKKEWEEGKEKMSFLDKLKNKN